MFLPMGGFGGVFSATKLAVALSIGVGLFGVGSCALHKIAASGRASAELAMVRAARKHNTQVARAERELRKKAEAVYAKAKADAERERKRAERARAALAAVTQVAEPGAAGECAPGCRLPENLRRILEGAQ